MPDIDMTEAPPSATAAAVGGAEVAAPSSAAPQQTHGPHAPLTHLLRLVAKIQHHDAPGIFSEPVSDEVAPNYSAIIKSPMDFSTLKGKVHARAYTTWRAFEGDLERICTNALTYNQKRSKVHKAASSLQRSLRKLCRDGELEGRRAVLLLHPEDPGDVGARDVRTLDDAAAEAGAVCAAAWRDEVNAANALAATHDTEVAAAEVNFPSSTGLKTNLACSLCRGIGHIHRDCKLSL